MFSVESAAGVSPAAAHRTVRKPLGLHGSYCSDAGFDMPPVVEESRIGQSDLGQDLPRLSLAASESFVLLGQPSHQLLIDAMQERAQRKRVIAPVIVKPSRDDGVDPPRKIFPGLCDTTP